GSALVYSVLLGGTGSEGASSVVLDPAGNAWVTGITGSVDFPVTVGAFDRFFNGVADVFVAELSADGKALLYSTYLGGTQSEGGVVHDSSSHFERLQRAARARPERHCLLVPCQRPGEHASILACPRHQFGWRCRRVV